MKLVRQLPSPLALQSQFLHLHPMKNLLTDVPGLRVGQADDAHVATGVTAIVFDEPAVASIAVLGGGTGPARHRFA